MSKTMEYLVQVFEVAHYGAANGPHDKTRLRAGIAAVVRALRDEILPPKKKVSASSTIVRAIILQKFNEILGAAGDEAAGGSTREDGQAPKGVASTPAATTDFAAHLARQRAFSERTFGPGERVEGVSDHIRKELLEVAKAKPGDERQAEWIDVVMLALDGAWRSGMSPEQIIHGLRAKLEKNERRTWPDWRLADPNKAIEHDRTKDAPAAAPACDVCRGTGFIYVRTLHDPDGPREKQECEECYAPAPVCEWREISTDALGYAWMNSSCGLVDFHERNIKQTPDGLRCHGCGKPIKFTEESK